MTISIGLDIGVSNLYLELYPNREKNGRIKFSDEGIIWNLYVTLMSDYPRKLSEDDPIQEFGSRVMQELFQTLPCAPSLPHLRKKLGGGYICQEILRTHREIDFADIEDQGYKPLYRCTRLTDALHEACGFRTDCLHNC